MILTVNNDPNDSCMFRSWDPGSIWRPGQKTDGKIDTSFVKFTRAEKDTLAQLASNIISHPIPQVRCLDCEGLLAIDISYNAILAVSIRYGPVGEWGSISPETLQLSEMLKRKLKPKL